MRSLLRKVLLRHRRPEIIRGFLTYENLSGRLVENRGVPPCPALEILGTIKEVYFLRRRKIKIWMLAKLRAKPGRAGFLGTNDKKIRKSHSTTLRR